MVFILFFIACSKDKFSHTSTIMMMVNSVNGFCYNVGTIRMLHGPNHKIRATMDDSFNHGRGRRKRLTLMNTMDSEDDGERDENAKDGEGKNENDMNFFEQVDTIPDLSWRVEKLRLEEANTRRFLKSKPRFLPYDECRKWVAAWNRWDSEEEWKTWINEGEKRNSYIPARPDEYYGRIGKWKGWDHFLGKTGDKDDCEDNDANDFQ